MSEDDNKVVKDYKESAKWYRKSAEQGNARPQRYLGLMYNNKADFLMHIKIILGVIAGIVIAIILKCFGHW
jgi:TPR repeat protein